MGFRCLMVMLPLLLAGVPGATEEPPGPYQRFLEQLEQENRRYAETHPGWPAGEPAPRNTVKKAFQTMTGKNLLEVVQDGIAVTRNACGDIPEEDCEFRVRLAIEQVMEFYPLIERTPQGYTNLMSLATSRNVDPLFRQFLIECSYPSGALDTLFSLYVREKFAENREQVLQRYAGLYENPEVDPIVHRAVLPAFYDIARAGVLDLLRRDRAVSRVLEEKGVEATPGMLTAESGIRISTDTREQAAALIKTLDTFLLSFRDCIHNESNVYEGTVGPMLDMLEMALEEFDLPSAEQHRELLAEQGRGKMDAPGN